MYIIYIDGVVDVCIRLSKKHDYGTIFMVFVLLC